MGQRIQLIGSGNINLRTHVGHKVEINGTMVPQGSAQGRQGQPAADMRLNVSSVRMLESTCSPAARSTGSAAVSRSMPSTQAQSAGMATFIECVERGSTANTYVLNVVEVPAGHQCRGRRR